MSTPVYHNPPPSATPHQVGLFDDSPPDIAGHTWLAFTLDHPEEQAAATFQARYSQAPAYIVESLGNLLLVGPVPDDAHARP